MLNIHNILAELTAEYAEKGHISPRTFVLSEGTAPVRLDPNFQLPTDESKADFFNAVCQAVKRLNANAVLTITQAFATRVMTDPNVQSGETTEAIFATLYERGAQYGTIWIATIERSQGASSLHAWVESRFRGTHRFRSPLEQETN
jgi:hypothetical protein